MTVTAVYDINKKKVGEVELPDDVFAAKVSEALIHQSVVAHLANCRQGTVSTKTRANVRGGGRKPYKQKGTGQARHGSIRSPIFVGGGVAFGPKPRDWQMELPKKQKRAALKSALSKKNQDGELFVIDGFVSKDGKTSAMAKAFKGWDSKSRVIVIDKADMKTIKAVRNIPNVKVVSAKELCVYDIVRHKDLLVVKPAIENIVTRVSQ